MHNTRRHRPLSSAFERGQAQYPKTINQVFYSLRSSTGISCLAAPSWMVTGAWREPFKENSQSVEQRRGGDAGSPLARIEDQSCDCRSVFFRYPAVRVRHRSKSPMWTNIGWSCALSTEKASKNRFAVLSRADPPYASRILWCVCSGPNTGSFKTDGIPVHSDERQSNGLSESPARWLE